MLALYTITRPKVCSSSTCTAFSPNLLKQQALPDPQVGCICCTRPTQPGVGAATPHQRYDSETWDGGPARDCDLSYRLPLQALSGPVLCGIRNKWSTYEGREQYTLAVPGSQQEVRGSTQPCTLSYSATPDGSLLWGGLAKLCVLSVPSRWCPS